MLHGIARSVCVEVIAVLCLAWAMGSTPAAAQGGAQNLRCENATSPRGVEASRPMLSWVTNPNAIQRGYQILVATTEEKLKANEADLWDSGLVRSDQKTARYQGKALSSRQRCYWKIRLWESYFQAGGYTEPANWEMGLLLFDDLKAK